MIRMNSVRVHPDAIKGIDEVLKSGNLIQGERVKDFEWLFARLVGAKHGVAVSSGSAALHIAYRALIQPEDEVLVPAFSHVSTASMVLAAGGLPIFCDINPDTLTIDVDDAESRITTMTSAIAPVHIFGNCCEVEAIIKLAELHELGIIWDACQAHGTKWCGQPIGGFPILNCYSFYATKSLAIGEGGMITTDSPQMAQYCRLLRSHGQESKYLHTLDGYNYRMTEVQATIGIAQLQNFERDLEARQKNAAFYNDKLQHVDGITLPKTEAHTTHSYHQYTIQCDNRNAVVEKLENQGIETAIHYPSPLHDQQIFDSYGELLVSEAACERVLSLPVHPYLNPIDLDSVVRAIRL